VYIKYAIMRVRAKISYTALVQRISIVELFIKNIMKSYKLFQHEGIIKDYSKEDRETQDKIYNNIIESTSLKRFLRDIIEFN
jgi:hypothetical protein